MSDSLIQVKKPTNFIRYNSETDSGGKILTSAFRINGILHRDDGPAYIEYAKDGSIYIESYWKNGFCLREDGPAYILYHSSGNPRIIEYRNQFGLHKEDGPAKISYDDNGEVEYSSYWLYGNKMSREEWYSKLSDKQKVKLLYAIANNN
jgi:hypothetical protein